MFCDKNPWLVLTDQVRTNLLRAPRSCGVGFGFLLKHQTVPSTSSSSSPTWESSAGTDGEYFTHMSILHYTALDQQPESLTSQIEWSAVLKQAAWYALRMGIVVIQERLALLSPRVTRSALGDGHTDTSHGMMMLGHAYRGMGQ